MWGDRSTQCIVTVLLADIDDLRNYRRNATSYKQHSQFSSRVLQLVEASCQIENWQRPFCVNVSLGFSMVTTRC